MKPWHHAHISAKQHGGKEEDYLPLHNWLDQTKSSHADMRHRTIFHNSLGPVIAEQVFGATITNSNGKIVLVRQLVEDHIMEDLGFIPNVTDYLAEMKLQPWMMGSKKRSKVIIGDDDE